MKKIIQALILITVCPGVFLQTDYLTSPYKYFVGTKNPGPGWQLADYADTSWKEGTGAIGYGDVTYAPHFTDTIPGPGPFLNTGDTIINTIIAPTTSLYLRYRFTINPQDTAGISGFSFEAYFDDGFIAYLNGAEFARANMGKKGDMANFNTLTDRSHESQIAAGDPYPVAGYYINKKFLQEHLSMGENTLAVEVHNDSLAGSDLFFKCSLKKCLRDTTYDPLASYWGNQQGIFTPDIRTKAYVELDSTKLPLIIIESNEFGIPFNHVEVPANMKVIDNTNGQLNYPSDTNYTYNGRIRIEVRGASSRYFPKQSFNIETENADGSNNNVPLLGMPAENDWKLFGPISDRSLIRNTFTFELGRKQGHWEPRSEFCELILNGEYLGLYSLMEKIKPDKNRLNISKLKDTDLYGNDVTGGYIFWKGSSYPVTIYYPGSNKIQPEQEDYLTAFVQRYWNVIFSDNWLNQDIDYRNYVNTESMLDYMIINELACEHDKYDGSVYMYKNRSDKDSLINFGPLWDFNYGYGNTIKSIITNKWVFNRGGYGDIQFQRLLQDTSLVHRFAEKWHDQRKRFLQTDSLFTLIDSLANYIADARKRDSMVWDAYTTVNVYFAKDTVYRYDQVIHNLKDWIQRRATWIDNHINSIYIPYQVVESENLAQYNQEHNVKVYPNPFHNQIKVELNYPVSGQLRLELHNTLGQLVQLWPLESVYRGQHILTLTILGHIPPGIYNLSIYQQDKPVSSVRVVKTE